MLTFDKSKFKKEKLTLEGRSIAFRSCRNLIYVEHPVVPEFQQMNIFVPEAYFCGRTINGYTAKTAPVFMPNEVGGYMPGFLPEPCYVLFGPKKPNAVFEALEHGYVVAAPAIRGRVNKDASGNYCGKAPALIVDQKAAVRFLHYFADELPGDQNKIITNGTSAGGALSALAGATGNHPDYLPYLKALGAAPASDAVFAASCYCPITNLEHADMAYEWEFSGVYDYHRMNMNMGEGGRPQFTPEDGTLSEADQRVSAELAALFPAYVNSLHLKDASGNPLTLDACGNGSFKEYFKSLILDSAARAEKDGLLSADAPAPQPGSAPMFGASAGPSGYPAWLSKQDGVFSMDFDGYVREITRMKGAPAFDTLEMDSAENDEFGSATENCRHFTDYSAAHSRVIRKAADKAETENKKSDLQTCTDAQISSETATAGKTPDTQTFAGIADPTVVKLLNPMNYIDDPAAETAAHWRIRHGECDRDTSLAISAILSLKLAEAGCSVDYRSPWATPHSGDYDLPELFAWIDSICK